MTDTLTTRLSIDEREVIDALQSAGFAYSATDGWFYPSGGPQRALVRLCVHGGQDGIPGQYQLARRRKLTTPWMIIAVRDTMDFDEDSFRSWCETWPLTVVTVL